MKALALIASMIIAVSTTPVLAQSFTVKKVKGKQAIVNMNSGTFSEGQTVTVGGDSSSSHSVSGPGGSRNNYLGLQGGLGSSKVGNSTITTFEAAVLYGWNKSKYEYGVLGGFASSSGGATSLSKFSIGGKFDFNFTEHRSGVPSLLSAGGEVSYQSISGGGDATALSIYPMVSYRWFGLGTTTAIRGDLGLDIRQTTSAGKSSSDSGLRANFGLFHYF